MGSIPIFIMILLLPMVMWDKLMDVDYEWWRKWIGEEPRKVGDPPRSE